MRELTKSMFSLSWAMSLFGLEQMAGLLTPASRSAGSFETVIRSTQEQLRPALRSTFQTGDTLQRRLVDLTFSLFTLGLWAPKGSRGGPGRGPGSRGWGRCDTGRRAWGQGEAGVGQQAGPGFESIGGSWQTGGIGGSGGTWTTAGDPGVMAAGAEAVREAGELANETLGWGIDLLKQAERKVDD
ncbi:MAG: hypothetical protein WAM82_32965 [Thermoanaerobaculia bacterium]